MYILAENKRRDNVAISDFLRTLLKLLYYNMYRQKKG